MKIRNLTIKGFRGFNEEIEIPFTSGLNLVYAPNGWGKSSLSEAIEWAIFGNTQRTIDAKSKIEFDGSYRNVHSEPSDTTCVGIDCKKDDQGITLIREMDSTEEDILNITPSSYSLPETWLVRPIIYQHALQRFIHTEPRKRWDEFANILGLGELEELRGILVNVKNNKEEAIPEEAKKFINRIRQIRATIDSFDQLKELKKPAKENAAILMVSSAIIGREIVKAEGGTKGNLINELSRLLKQRQRAVFDVSIFSLKALDQASSSSLLRLGAQSDLTY